MSSLVPVLLFSSILVVSHGRAIVDGDFGFYNPDSWRPVEPDLTPGMEKRAYSQPIRAQERFFFGKKEDEHHDDHGYFDYDHDYDYGYHHHFLDRYADEDYPEYEENKEGFSIASFVGNILNWS